MNTEQLKDHLDCYTDFTIIVSDIFPTKFVESTVFDAALNKYISKLKERISVEEFKKFQKILAVRLKEAVPMYKTFPIPYPENDEWRHGEGFFRQLANDDLYAPLAYVQDTFTELVKHRITEILEESIIEYFSITKTLPPAAEIFEINLSFIHFLLEDFQAYDLDLGPLGAFYYLKHCTYKKSSNTSTLELNKIGEFEFQFCLWDIAE